MVRRRHKTEQSEYIPVPMQVRWTKDLVAELARLWVVGLNISAIAKALGISRSSVVGKIRSLHLYGLIPTSERVDYFRR